MGGYNSIRVNLMAKLTIDRLIKEASAFSAAESHHAEKSLYGVTDGKAVGTYLEHKFKAYLQEKYAFEAGSSASGIDFPELQVDMKVTSVSQPQSSSPFKSARQKIYGLGYSLLVFVYEKVDKASNKTARLNILHTIFVEASRTADYSTTKGLLQILEFGGNRDDVFAFLSDRYFPVDELEMYKIADELIANPPVQGYLASTPVYVWKQYYMKAIELAGKVGGIRRVSSLQTVD